MAAPSSNSSPAEPSSPAFILDSLETLRREYPYVYDRMCAALAPRSLRLTIDGQSLPLRFEPGRHLSPDQLPEPDVRLATSRQTILEVIDARYSLEQAVDLGLIDLAGTTTDLSAFHDALLMYVRGAVRCPSFPALLERYRRS